MLCSDLYRQCTMYHIPKYRYDIVTYREIIDGVKIDETLRHSY